MYWIRSDIGIPRIDKEKHEEAGLGTLQTMT